MPLYKSPWKQERETQTRQQRLATFALIIFASLCVHFIGSEFVVENQVASVAGADPMKSYIEELHKYECRNCPPNFSKIDTDGERVWGCLQFKIETFERQARKFNLIGDNLEAEDLIHDCSIQKLLAKMMLEENPRKIWFWRTSIERGLELPPNYK